MAVDFTQVYGIRLDSLRDEAGSWPWVRDHVLGLLGEETRLARALESRT